jgi:hypothetical protein
MSRKSRQRGVTRLSDLKLRVMAEYDSSGIWVIEQVGPFRHSDVDYNWLGLPPNLAGRFKRWIITYWAYYDQAMFDEEYPEFNGFVFDIDTFNQEGRELAYRLKAHMGARMLCGVSARVKRREWLGQD